MKHKYQPTVVRGGAVIQGGLNVQARGAQDPTAPLRGPYRAIVVETYPPDHDKNRSGYAVECDVVLVLTQKAVKNVPVKQRSYGVNDTNGPWCPRPSRRTLNGAPLNFSRVYGSRGRIDNDPTAFDNVDGDMVLVDFMEGNPNLPFIDGALTHERSKRVLKTGDGWAESGGAARGEPQSEEYYFRHAGTEIRVNKEGDLLVDTVGATSDQENEVPGSGGQLRMRVKNGKKFTVEIDGVDVFEVYRDGTGGRIDLIEGAAQAFIRGNSYTSAEAAFLSALSVVMTALGVYATAAGPMVPAGVLVTAIGAFQTALASFSPPAHLSTRVKGE